MKRYLTIENLFLTMCAAWLVAAVFNVCVIFLNHPHTQTVEPKPQNNVENIETEECIRQIRSNLRIIRHDIDHISDMLEKRH